MCCGATEETNLFPAFTRQRHVSRYVYKTGVDSKDKLGSLMVASELGHRVEGLGGVASARANIGHAARQDMGHEHETICVGQSGPQACPLRDQHKQPL